MVTEKIKFTFRVRNMSEKYGCFPEDLPETIRYDRGVRSTL
jgi:hypothetical protein